MIFRNEQPSTIWCLVIGFIGLNGVLRSYEGGGDVKSASNFVFVTNDQAMLYFWEAP
jgi:hypothetical protein